MSSWNANGMYYSTDLASNCDLIRERKAFRCERWVNVYQCVGVKDGYYVGEPMELKDHADRNHMPHRLACVKVIIEGHEGDGLDAETP
jgi:hypothetical protein